MTLGKMISLAGGLWTAAILAFVLLGPRLGFLPDWPGQPGWLALLCVGMGLLGALLGYLVFGTMVDHDVARLRRQVQAFGTDEQVSSTLSAPFYLRGLGQAVEKVLTAQQHRIEQLTAGRRELEIQSRIAEAERQHAETILQSISDAVLVTNAFNEVALANEAAAEALGFDLSSARHQPIERLVQDPTLVKLIRDTRESGNPRNRRHLEHHVQHQRHPAVYDVTMACVANPQAEVAGVVTILHDVTREKQAEQMKSNFVSSVSHELRTPLSSIKAYIEMLVDGEAQDEATRQEFYSIIQSEANRLSRLIDNILNISRIESGIIKLQREPVDPAAVIGEVIDVMQPQARTKQIDLSYRRTPVFGTIHGDRDMIYQAVLNLVSNALKYTPEGGRVVIDTGHDPVKNRLTISVSDTGVGIPSQALPHLFDKFYRVQEHKKMAKGTGLGLNLVKHIVETLHGGEVSVVSQPGQGSTFCLALPMTEEAM